MERAVFYARVSTEEEKQLNALSKQVEECRDCIRAQGWALVGEYVDEGKSGTKVRGRDEYRRLFEDLEEDKFDIIVIKSQDRLMRNVKDWYLFLDKMITHGKRLYIYLDGGFYTSDNALITGIKAILAEEYSRDLSKKLNNANRRRIERAKAGEPVSAMGTNLTYGYYIKDGAWVVDREQAKTVKLIYELYLKHDSVRMVLRSLNNLGIKNQCGRCFCADSITRILKNERYKGVAVLNRFHRDFDLKKVIKNPEEEWVLIEGAHEAIIDPETWEKVNTRLRSKVGKKRGRKVSRDPLGGKLFCASCGGVLWRHKANGYTSWYCSNHYSRDEGGCKEPVSISQVKLRKILSALIGSLEVNRAAVKASMIKWLGELKDRLSEADTSSQAVSEIERLSEKKERLTDAYLDGIIQKADYARKLSEIEKKISENEKLLIPAEENEDIKDIEEILKNIDRELDKWMLTNDFEESKIDFLLEHIKRITVSKEKHLIIELDLIGGVILAGESFLLYVRGCMHIPVQTVNDYEVELRLAA